VSAAAFLQALQALPTEALRQLLEAMRAARAIDVTPSPARLEAGR
jgi:hypothetical protein